MSEISDDEALAALYEAVTHAVNLQRRLGPHYLGSPDLRLGVESLMRVGEDLGLIDPKHLGARH